MSPIFSTEDVVTLLGTFPTTKDPPAFVHSRSGDGLLRWYNVLQKFHETVARSTSRIDRISLPSLLDIEDDALPLLVSEIESKLSLSRDGRSIIPNAQSRQIITDLTTRAQNACVDIRSFSQEESINISLPSFKRLIDGEIGDGYRLFSDATKGGPQYLCSLQQIQKIEDQSRAAISASEHRLCDLSSIAPLPVLRELARGIATEAGATIQVDGDRVMAMPAQMPGAHRNNLTQDEKARFVQKLIHDGYCILHFGDVQDDDRSILDTSTQNGNALVRGVLEEYENSESPVSPVQVVNVLDGVSEDDRRRAAVVIKKDVLGREMEIMQSTMRAYAEQAWSTGEKLSNAASVVQGALSSLQFGPSELAKLLWRSELAVDLTSVVESHLKDLDDLEREKFLEASKARLLYLFLLYDGGIGEVKDETLVQHLESFLLDHFRHDVIPQTLEHLNQQQLLRDKTCQREANKLRQASADAKTWAALRSAITRFSKKLNIDLSDERALERSKRKTMQSTVRSLPQITRGSDVLQNLIWICLASRARGLFMSSGKDTSRMIKTYETIGNTQVAAQLVKWRDMLKAGQEGKEDVQEMRELAMRVLEEMAPLDKSQQNK